MRTSTMTSLQYADWTIDWAVGQGGAQLYMLDEGTTIFCRLRALPGERVQIDPPCIAIFAKSFSTMISAARSRHNSRPHDTHTAPSNQSYGIGRPGALIVDWLLSNLALDWCSRQICKWQKFTWWILSKRWNICWCKQTTRQMPVSHAVRTYGVLPSVDYVLLRYRYVS